MEWDDAAKVGVGAPASGPVGGAPEGGVRRHAVSRVAVAALAVLVVLALAGMVAAYFYYQNTLRAAQERSLTIMAETAAQNLTSYFDQRMGELDMQFSDANVARAVEVCSGDVIAALDELLAGFGVPDACVSAVVRVAVDDAADGVPADRQGAAPPSDADVRFALGSSWHSFASAAAGRTETFVGYWFLDGDAYTMALYRPIRVAGELVGYVAELVDLEAVYHSVLGSVQVGEQGYCTVKDPDYVIVMHRLASQIGVDTRTDRAGNYPEGDWDDLFASQYSGESGCQIVRSYWWDDMDAGPARKFIAYAPAYIDGNFFSVNVVMAYDELMRPLQSMWALCIALGAAVLLMVALGGWYLARSVQGARHLQRELSYEKELHAQTQRLKLQERQIQRIDRLQTMGIVTSSLAHELKNLMTPLLVYGQMLKDDDLTPEERREVADEVEKLSQRCADLLKRMLSYVRERKAEEGRTFDATEAVRDALVMIRPLCPRDVTLVEDVCESPCRLEGDPGAVGQIMLNLVTNALYAMRDGGGELGVSWAEEPSAGGRPAAFALCVRDTGCGMDRETQRRLFNSFFTTKGDEGTGLGMSVVQALVQSMHGSIEVWSEPGKGSAFTLRFTAVEDEARDDSGSVQGAGGGLLNKL